MLKKIVFYLLKMYAFYDVGDLFIIIKHGSQRFRLVHDKKRKHW